MENVGTHGIRTFFDIRIQVFALVTGMVMLKFLVKFSGFSNVDLS